MATDKKSFILYADYITTIEELTDEEAGKLVKHLFRYVNDLHPEPPVDRVVKLTFEPIKQQLKRDLKDWENKKVKRSEAGKAGGVKSGEVRKQNEANVGFASNNEANEANASNSKQNEANEAVNGNVTVNVNDTVIVTVTANENDSINENSAWNEFPKSNVEIFLNEMDIQSAIEQIKITKNVLINSEKVQGMLPVFKNIKLDGIKHYKTERDVVKHFLNWIKDQKFYNNANITGNHKTIAAQQIDTTKQIISTGGFGKL